MTELTNMPENYDNIRTGIVELLKAARSERRTLTTKTVRETEAESIAFIVGRAVGLDTGSAGADYISLYHGNAELLTESLAVIQKASATILNALFAVEVEPLANAS